MFQRLSLLASTLAVHFETILNEEIAKIDLAEYRRRNNVLVPRGLVAPPLIAFYKALRLALLARPAVKEGPVHKHRLHAIEVGDILTSAESSKEFPPAPIDSDRTGSRLDRLHPAKVAQLAED